MVEENDEMPDRFRVQVSSNWGDAAESSWGKFGMSLLGALHAQQTSENADSFEVWQCTRCGCEACYQIEKGNGSWRKSKVAEITNC